jgi:hypothetical protein|nr:MAG TPA: hypothetical protein [Bacteriophage sp.]
MLASEALAITNVKIIRMMLSSMVSRNLKRKLKNMQKRDIEIVLLASIVIRMDIGIL